VLFIVSPLYDFQYGKTVTLPSGAAYFVALSLIYDGDKF